MSVPKRPFAKRPSLRLKDWVSQFLRFNLWGMAIDRLKLSDWETHSFWDWETEGQRRRLKKSLSLCEWETAGLREWETETVREWDWVSGSRSQTHGLWNRESEKLRLRDCQSLSHNLLVSETERLKVRLRDWNSERLSLSVSQYVSLLVSQYLETERQGNERLRDWETESFSRWDWKIERLGDWDTEKLGDLKQFTRSN